MLKIENVPYRIWGNGRYRDKLVDAKEGKRVFNLGMREMQAGKAVNMTFSQPVNSEPPHKGMSPFDLEAIYDTISISVED